MVTPRPSCCQRSRPGLFMVLPQLRSVLKSESCIATKGCTEARGWDSNLKPLVVSGCHQSHPDLSGQCFHQEPGRHLGLSCCQNPCLGLCSNCSCVCVDACGLCHLKGPQDQRDMLSQSTLHWLWESRSCPFLDRAAKELALTLKGELAPAPHVREN